MATTTHVAGAGESSSNAAKVKASKVLNIVHFIIPIVGVGSLAAFGRWFQGTYGWSAGLDSNSQIFEEVWMSFFYVETVLAIVVFGAVMTGIWMTRDRALDQLQPGEETKRYFRLTAMLLGYVFAVFFAGSYFAEQDASWHQTVVRDTSFTPSHIVLFYGSFPLYIILGFASFMYARTRLPQFATRISVPYVLAIIGPLMILPNVGFNEWGHTFWLMEEWFTAPLHWGFVVLGWTALALGGLLLQIVARFGQLLGMTYATASEEA